MFKNKYTNSSAKNIMKVEFIVNILFKLVSCTLIPLSMKTTTVLF